MHNKMCKKWMYKKKMPTVSRQGNSLIKYNYLKKVASKPGRKNMWTNIQLKTRFR